MPRCVLICGLPGSGKTTCAKRLESELPALRLTPDEWIELLYGSELTLAQLDAARLPVETLLWSVGLRALELGTNVVQDFGVWSRAERDQFRRQAWEAGATTELVFLDVPLDELWRRLEARNAELPPHTFRITREQLWAWSDMFEPPQSDELGIAGPLSE